MAIVSEEVRIPNFGLKLDFNHKYPEKWSQAGTIRFHQFLAMFSMILRYLVYYVKNLWYGQIPVMDYVRMETGKQIYGVPVGGIGSGTIGRGYRGEFCRFQLKPGVYEYNTVDANQFIVTIKDNSGITLFQSVLSGYQKTSKHLKSWKWLLNGSKCKYTGLYPRAWTEYDLSEYGIKLICRQISPVIPHNYKDSSLPCAVFVWNMENVSEEKRIVTIAFTFKNGTGSKADRKSMCSSKSFSYMDTSGVVLYNSADKIPCAYALAAKVQNGTEVSKCLSFDPCSDGKEPWNQLYKNGEFDKLKETESDQACCEMACGIATRTGLNPADVKLSELCLVWDMPRVTFPSSSNKTYYKYYTKHFGRDNSILKIVDHALKNYSNWDLEIHKWQKPVLEDSGLPDWYKCALFNETYFISDGGTVWLTLDGEEAETIPVTDPRYKYGRFAYLEGHEYRMYNTYDVHFYASFALAINWPNLQLCLQYDIKDAIFTEISTPIKMLYDGLVVERKVKNSVPHDVGDPNESPFLLINAYPVHDVSEWRDLNVKFVLQVLRDYHLIQNNTNIDSKQYLQDMYEACQTVISKSLKFDTDKDGLIENSGNPDQTYDNWVMLGASAYCGGLWLGALYAMIVISRKLNKVADMQIYEDLLKKGKAAFETKLWNGNYYNFDCSENSSTVMADQLCGHWYLRSCGFKYEVFPQSSVEKALSTVYQNNVMSFHNGTLGAVNGYKLNIGADIFSAQSEEVWTGVTYGLAACLLQENLDLMAWKTAGGMYETLTTIIGMAFETPEALTGSGHYRAIGYMRPLSIWAMQLAWDQRKQIG